MELSTIVSLMMIVLGFGSYLAGYYHGLKHGRAEHKSGPDLTPDRS